MRRLIVAFVTVLCLAGAAQADDRADCAQQADLDLLIRSCTKFIAAGGESAENLARAYFNRAGGYGKKGDYDHAIADLDQAITLSPDFAWAYASRGASYGRKGDYDRAIADETRAIELNPELAFAYADRGIAFDNKGNYDRAIPDFDKAIELEPDLEATLRARLAVLRKTRTPQAGPPSQKPAVEPPAVAHVAADRGRRVALVIGNSAYQNVAQLTNPTNDAKLIAAALRQDGFGVTLAYNLDHDGLIKALRAFATEADNADWAVVYFAGHGIEMAGTNYLLPVDAKLLTDRDVDFEAVPIGQVMSAIDGAHVLRVVILDACRNNPFAATLKRTAGEGRDVGRGLARIEPARGTEVIYSAKEGTIAADGDGADSPFATALAQHLTEPGLEVDKLFRLVRDDVLDATGNKQEPFVYGSLPGRADFYFRSN